ncbi:MAG: hypothetical protein HC831_05445 [Chloroflexia bacterium]|nr:hypothetical protein [Chloroflexia bacterium]
MKTKRIHKVLAGLLILGIIGFTACKKEEVVKVFGFVQGFVYDGTTNTILDDVKVTWEVAGKQDSTTATAADGFKINDLYSGTYILKFSKTGYSTVIDDISVPMDDFTATAKGGANKEYMVSVNPVMYPLNAGVVGRVYKSENSRSIPIEGAIVRAEMPNSNLIPRIYETTTDADGYYNFENLPAVSYVYIRVLEYIDSNGEKYYDYYNDFNIVPGAVTTISAITLSHATDPLMLTNTSLWIAPGVVMNDVPVTTRTFTLTFNKDIDQAVSEERRGDTDLVRLTGAGITTADYSFTISGNVVTLTTTIDLTAASNYTINYNLYTAQPYDGLNSSVSFTTAN